MTLYTAKNGLLGGTRDILLEVGTENFGSVGAWEPAAPQCSATPLLSVRFDFTVPGADAHIATGLEGETTGVVVTFEIRAVALGAETAVLANPSRGYRPIQLAPDGKLRVYDLSGALLGESQEQVSTAFRHVVVVDDGSRGPQAQRTVHLFVDGVEQFAVPSVGAFPLISGPRSATGWGWGDSLGAGVATGTVYELRGALLQSFTTEAESPRRTRWPMLRAAAVRRPTAEGEIHDWADGTTPSPNTWQDVDEAPNDGDTTRIADLSSPPGKVHVFRSGAPNPLPVGASVLGVQVSCAARVAGSAKAVGPLLVRLAGQQATSSSLSATTDYRGFGWLFPTRPGGGSWQRADFDPDVFQFGMRSDPDSDPPGAVCSSLCYQVVYWTELLPLASDPLARPRTQVLIV